MEKSWKIIRKKSDSKPVYGDNDKYIKAKMKIYNSSKITIFYSTKMPKKNPYNSLSIAI